MADEIKEQKPVGEEETPVEASGESSGGTDESPKKPEDNSEPRDAEDEDSLLTSCGGRLWWTKR